MLTQTEGKIFIAAGRHCSEHEGMRSYQTMGFGKSAAQSEGLYHVSEDTLGGAKSWVGWMETASELILIPTVGAIIVSDSSGREVFVEAGKLLRQPMPKGTTFEIRNPYKSELVNYLQLRIASEGRGRIEYVPVALATACNKLQPLLSRNLQNNNRRSLQQLSIGVFDGRSEITYQPRIAGNTVFFFVLEGAFEIQYRLLERRDGLLLFQPGDVAIEALSNNALLLAIEYKS